MSSDEQVKALLVSLRLNLALACTKEQRYADAVSACTKVLEADSTNVKVSLVIGRVVFCFEAISWLLGGYTPDSTQLQ